MEKLFVYFAFFYETFPSIRLSEKFLPFHEEIIDAQCFLCYISLHEKQNEMATPNSIK